MEKRSVSQNINDPRNYSERHPSSKSFSELKREISIIELATRNGYSNKTRWAKEKSCAAYPCFENEWGDRFYIINPQASGDQKYYDLSLSRKGDLIDFVRTRLDTLFQSYRLTAKSETGAINAVLHDYLGISVEERNSYRTAYQDNNSSPFSRTVSKEEIFHLELFDLQPLTDTRYLEQSGIDPKILFCPLFEGRIFNVRNPEFKDGQFVGYSRFVNTAFPYFVSNDEKIVGLEERNFNFKGHGITSQKSAGVWYSNPPESVKSVFLLESGKDALSHFELHRPEGALYFSTGGQVTYEQINSMQRILSTMNLSPDATIRLGHDNDKNGAIYDFMYICEAAAGKYPIVQRASTKDYLSLTIAPQKDEAVSFAEKLLSQLQTYNQPVYDLINENDNNQDVRLSLEKSIYHSQFTANQLRVEIPRTYFGIHHFNQAFLQATGIEKKIVLDKPVLKDFNDDLKQKKGLYTPALQTGISTGAIREQAKELNNCQSNNSPNGQGLPTEPRIQKDRGTKGPKMA